MTDCSISIIIPAYNVEKYLTASLASIKNQVELPDEVILINDGSTDDTLEIAKSFDFAVSYKIVSIENCGQGIARNLGVMLASSQYIYFFDADDLLVSNCIRTLKDQIRIHQSPDIVLFSGKSFNDSDYQGSRWVNYRRGFSGFFFDRERFLDKALFSGALFCSPCLYVSKRVLWEGGALKFESSFFEDDALFYPLIFSCGTYYVFDEVLFLRRNRHNSTMTMVRSQKHVDGAFTCMETTLALFSSEGLTARERWHIGRKLGSQCVAYIVSCREAGVPVKVAEVFSVLTKVKSPILAMKAFLYIIRINEFTAGRFIIRSFAYFVRAMRR